MKRLASLAFLLLALFALNGLQAAELTVPVDQPATAALSPASEVAGGATTAEVTGLPEVTFQGTGCFMEYCACELSCRDLGPVQQEECANQCYEDFQACLNG